MELNGTKTNLKIDATKVEDGNVHKKEQYVSMLEVEVEKKEIKWSKLSGSKK